MALWYKQPREAFLCIHYVKHFSGLFETRALVYSSCVRPTPYVYTIGVLMTACARPFGAAMIQIIFDQDQSSAFTVLETTYCALLRTRSPMMSAPSLWNNEIESLARRGRYYANGRGRSHAQSSTGIPTSSFTTRHRQRGGRAWRPGLISYRTSPTKRLQ